MSRKILLNSYKSSAALRLCSTLSHISTNIDSTGCAVISMNKAPVNSLNLEMLLDLKKNLNAALENKCKGVILTSDLKSVFSGGLDILEMYKPQEERLKEFWSSLQDIGLLLYGFKIPVIAAINGHSPAGGCYLSLTTDYRIMVQKYSIGLNETKLGIVAPFWFREPMINTIGYRQAELALELGTLFTTEDALKIGLVDEMVPDKATAIDNAKKKILEFSVIPKQAFQMTKLEMRRPVIEKLLNNREADLNQFVSFCTSPEVQKSLEFYLETLKKKK
ncbi:enoyl-CoA delta isomerase 1, mitochondrial-like [Artemia franciscana]|uniref:enoyl-CoA delta isomerase 1, mitochondrial-like n=1 Tax=Artemia franciscana TaxID=6661 RepID=UPI0032DBDD55